MAKRRETEKPDRYFQLHHYMLKTDAWRALSAQARAVYVQIGSRYSGTNNGRLALSVRDAASECNLSRETASRALHELVDLGFTEETRHGGLSRKTRVASEWRLTAFRCDLTGAPKTCAFMQRGVPARESHLVRARPQTDRLSQTTAQPVLNDGRECPKRRHSLSQTTAHSIAECPKRRHTHADFEPSPVLNDGTHIIYQSPSARGDPTPEGEAAAPNAPKVATAAFDLIDGSFRIGDRRIVLRKPAADAMDLTAGLLAEQLAASHPSNSQYADSEQPTVDVLSRPALAH